MPHLLGFDKRDGVRLDIEAGGCSEGEGEDRGEGVVGQGTVRVKCLGGMTGENCFFEKSGCCCCCCVVMGGFVVVVVVVVFDGACA
jgi:hypothetical protein